MGDDRRSVLRPVDTTITRARADLRGRALAAGKLHIEELVGAGAVGAVYRARHRDLRMPVAVKILLASFQSDLDFCARFHAEALAASSLSHPNLTRVYDFGQEPDGLLYLAMEFLDGVDLRTILRDELVVDATRAVRIMLQACAGLGHAHARGVVHRDIKPENLVLVAGTDDDGRQHEHVKVCDFGIAQAGAAVQELAGTPDYMSPERWLGAPLDARSDVYACGVVLYELVTGAVPFVALDVDEASRKHIQAFPTPPSRHCVDLDPRVERVILRALAKDPASRQQSMRELRAELKAAIDLVPPASVVRPRTSQDLPPSSSVAPDWLEDRRTSYSAFLATTTSEQSAAAATALARGPEKFVARLAETTDPFAFAAMVEPLERAIRTLAEEGDVASLARLAAALDAAIEASDLDARESTLAPAMKLLSDPTFLTPLAQLALDRRSPVVSPATALVVRAGAAGAYALYAARVRTSDVGARLPFAAGLRAIGTPAAPILRAGLEHLERRLGAAGAVDVAIDLLAAAPAVADDATGAVLVRYITCAPPRLVVEAVLALARVWRARACPFLVGLLGDADERVRCTAMRAIAEVGGMAPDIVRRVRPIVESSWTTASELCVAAAALGYATSEARAEAAAILSGAFGAVVQSLDAGDEVVVTLARALLATGGPQGRALVEEARDRTPSLRVALGAVLDNRDHR